MIAASVPMARLAAALLLIAQVCRSHSACEWPSSGVLTLLVAPILGRWGMVYAVTRYPYARAAGAGAPFRNRDNVQLILATIMMLLLLATSAFVIGSLMRAITGAFVLAALLLAVALLVLLGWLASASRRLGGGLTGDTYGAACVLVEMAVLVLAPPLAMLAGRIAG